jgi:hypothetical protein
MREQGRFAARSNAEIASDRLTELRAAQVAIRELTERKAHYFNETVELENELTRVNALREDDAERIRELTEQRDALAKAIIERAEHWEADAKDADFAAGSYRESDVDASVELSRQANRSRGMARELRAVLGGVGEGEPDG